MAFPVAHHGSMGAGLPLSSHYPGTPSVFSKTCTDFSRTPFSDSKASVQTRCCLSQTAGLGTFITHFQNSCFICCIIYLNLGVLISQPFNNRKLHDSFVSPNGRIPSSFPAVVSLVSLYHFSLVFRHHEPPNRLTSHLSHKRPT